MVSAPKSVPLHGSAQAAVEVELSFASHQPWLLKPESTPLYRCRWAPPTANLDGYLIPNAAAALNQLLSQNLQLVY